MEPCWDLRRDIALTDCKEDHIGEGIQGSESTGSVLDDLDDPIESFGDGVGQMSGDEGDNFFAVFSEGIDEFPHGFETSSEC